MVRRCGLPNLRKVIPILLMETDRVFVKFAQHEDLSKVQLVLLDCGLVIAGHSEVEAYSVDSV